jgi:hypothetical protein
MLGRSLGKRHIVSDLQWFPHNTVRVYRKLRKSGAGNHTGGWWAGLDPVRRSRRVGPEGLKAPEPGTMKRICARIGQLFVARGPKKGGKMVRVRGQSVGCQLNNAKEEQFVNLAGFRRVRTDAGLRLIRVETPS